MADLNQSEQNLAETINRVAEDIRRYGKVTQETMDAMAAGSSARDQQLKSAKGVAQDALLSVGSAGMAAAKAMYEGQKGAGAFNGALDHLSQAAMAAGTALTFLIPGGPVIKGLIAGLTLVTTAAIKLTQTQNDMADKLYKGYSGMGKAGAAAADGMSGLFEDAKKLGLSMNELDSFVGVVTENRQDLAAFSGTVFQGRKNLADMGKALEGNREEFLRMGLSMQDVTAGMGGYLKIQTKIGASQNKTVDELAEGARKYLYEQDLLTKLTGMTRQEQEAAREEALSEQRFAAKLEELRQQGRSADAEEMMKANIMLRFESKEAAQAFRDLSTNTVGTEAAQKGMMSSQGEMMRSAQQLSSGQITAAQAVQGIVRSVGETGKRLGPVMGQLGTFDTTFINFGDSIKMAGKANRDFEAESQKVAKALDDQRKGIDPATAKMAELGVTQIQANEATERFVRDGMEKATDQMILLAKATNSAVNGLNKLFGMPAQREVEKTRKETQAKEDKAAAAAAAAAAKPKDKAAQDAAAAAALESQEESWKTRQQEAENRKKKRDAARAKGQKPAETVPAAAAPSPAAPAAAAPAPTAPAPAAPAPTAPAAPQVEGGQTQKGREGAARGAPAAPVAAPAAAAPATGTPSNVKVGPDANLAGVDQKLIDSFNQFAREFGQPISINSAYRDDKKQAELWVRANIFKEPGVKVPARPKDTTTIDYKGQEYTVQGGRGSKHADGEALDITAAGLGPTPSKVDALLAQFGLHRPHLPKDEPHIELMADGGITKGLSIAGEAGPEAVIPLKNENVPVKITADSTIGQTLVSLDSTMRELLSAHRDSLVLLQEIRRANDTAAGASVKMARAAMN